MFERHLAQHGLTSLGRDRPANDRRRRSADWTLILLTVVITGFVACDSNGLTPTTGGDFSGGGLRQERREQRRELRQERRSARRERRREARLERLRERRRERRQERRDEAAGEQETVAQPAPEEAENCTPGYSPCLPPASDYDCAGGAGDGPEYVSGTVRVTGADPYDLDSDDDGIGCED